METSRLRGETDHTVVISLRGELDLYVAPDVKRTLLSAIDQGAQKLVVDLRDASFIDSTILGVLLTAAKRLRPVGGEVAVICAQHSIRRLFEATVLDEIFPIYDDLVSMQADSRA